MYIKKEELIENKKRESRETRSIGSIENDRKNRKKIEETRKERKQKNKREQEYHRILIKKRRGLRKTDGRIKEREKYK